MNWRISICAKRIRAIKPNIVVLLNEQMHMPQGEKIIGVLSQYPMPGAQMSIDMA